MPYVDPHCQAANKCWEHWQPSLRVTQHAIDLAMQLTSLYLRARDLDKARAAFDLVERMSQRQWCEMVRRPFNFPAKDHPVPKPAPPWPKPRATIEDLLI